ncbi:MAG: hypothetical protein HW380_3686 [Magnetococcales bacterium]|nr:hypothetical protein [Magnetococcales bacterium]
MLEVARWTFHLESQAIQAMADRLDGRFAVAVIFLHDLLQAELM